MHCREHAARGFRVRGLPTQGGVQVRFTTATRQQLAIQSLSPERGYTGVDPVLGCFKPCPTCLSLLRAHSTRHRAFGTLLSSWPTMFGSQPWRCKPGTANPCDFRCRVEEGQRQEPFEELVCEIDDDHTGAVIEAVTLRKGEVRLLFVCLVLSVSMLHRVSECTLAPSSRPSPGARAR